MLVCRLAALRGDMVATGPFKMDAKGLTTVLRKAVATMRGLKQFGSHRPLALAAIRTGGCDGKITMGAFILAQSKSAKRFRHLSGRLQRERPRDVSGGAIVGHGAAALCGCVAE
jgi:hypothetical protein